MKHILETERLTLQELSIDDAPFIIKLLNSPGWLKYIGDKNVHTEEQAQNYLKNGPIKSYEENGFGLWLVKSKSDKSMLGLCGLLKRNFLENPDIGFAFLPEYGGQGYACEIATAVMHHAKTRLAIHPILAIVMNENEKSKRLLEKVGLQYSRPMKIPGETVKLLLYTSHIQADTSKLFKLTK